MLGLGIKQVGSVAEIACPLAARVRVPDPRRRDHYHVHQGDSDSDRREVKMGYAYYLHSPNTSIYDGDSNLLCYIQE